MDQVVEAIVALRDEWQEGRMGHETEHALTRHVVDAIGCALGGWRDSSAVIARQAASQRGEGGACSILGVRDRVSAELAAFANGAMIRCLDLNDTYASDGGVGHPSDYIAAMLAVGEEVGATGRRVLAAIGLGYEVFGRLTDAARLGVTRWDQVTHGVVASAAGAGQLMGLTDEELGHAVSLAAISNLGLHEMRFGQVAMWKNCAAANASRNGIFAARLAGLGMTGPQSPYEGRSGVIGAAAPEFDLGPMTERRGETVIEGCHLKRYPAGFFSQSAIDAALAVHGEVGDMSGVSKVTVETFKFGKTVMAGDPEKWAPQTRESADHSLPFIVASALVFGELNMDSYGKERLSDRRIRQVLDCLEVVETDACNAAWPEAARSNVTVVGPDGAERSATVTDYRGHRRNRMADEEISLKLAEQARDAFEEDSVARVREALWNLPQEETITGLLSIPALRN